MLLHFHTFKGHATQTQLTSTLFHPYTYIPLTHTFLTLKRNPFHAHLNSYTFTLPSLTLKKHTRVIKHTPLSHPQKIPSQPHTYNLSLTLLSPFHTLSTFSHPFALFQPHTHTFAHPSLNLPHSLTLKKNSTCSYTHTPSLTLLSPFHTPSPFSHPEKNPRTHTPLLTLPHTLTLLSPWKRKNFHALTHLHPLPSPLHTPFHTLPQPLTHLSLPPPFSLSPSKSAPLPEPRTPAFPPSRSGQVRASQHLLRVRNSGQGQLSEGIWT